MLYSKVSIAILLMATFFVGVSAYERYGVEREMAERLELRNKEFESLKQRAAALEANVEHLRNERGIEEELRSRFDVAREGEQVVIILEDEGKEETHASSNIDSSEKQDDKDTWWNLLKFW